MAKKARKPASGDVATNRRARHKFELLDRFEAGIELTGTEVKSLRDGKAQLGDAYAVIDRGEVWLRNAHIPPYPPAASQNHGRRDPAAEGDHGRPSRVLAKADPGALHRAGSVRSPTPRSHTPAPGVRPQPAAAAAPCRPSGIFVASVIL